MDAGRTRMLGGVGGRQQWRPLPDLSVVGSAIARRVGKVAFFQQRFNHFGGHYLLH